MKNVTINEEVAAPFDSSNISRVSYAEGANLLFVNFKGSSTFYVYQGVPVNVWANFKEAESKGKFFQANIKDFYTTVSVNPEV